MTVDEKRQLELKTMYQIIGIYCRDKHHTPKGDYVRSAKTFGIMQSIVLMYGPHMESKTFCSVCKTHC